jgi:hypothetical protein
MRKGLSPLHLHLHLPDKNVQRLIWRYLSKYDKWLVWYAHGVKRHLLLNFLDVEEWCFRHQNTVLFQWLVENEPDWFKLTSYTIDSAMLCKSLYMIHWLWKIKCPIDWHGVVEYASQTYWLNLLKWVFQHFPVSYKDRFWKWVVFPALRMETLSKAELQNCIETLKWAEAHGCHINAIRYTFY